MRMEAICNLNVPIWHLCFGFPGSMNDLYILSVSPMFGDVLAVTFPGCSVQYDEADENFHWMYLLTDGIYPEYKIFISTVSVCRSTKAWLFSSIQEAVRKYVDMFFVVLSKRFRVLQRLSRYSENMQVMMQLCCVLQNMLVDDRKEWFTGNEIGGLGKDLFGMMNENQ